jgi:ATP-dependent exoDNAse (exonuclease V) beta subunit
MLEQLKLISAGAGSGKTYRLTNEMAQLLTDGTVRPSGIIATTFTKRAAAELKERVRVKLLRSGMSAEANALQNALIGTVHGLGVKLLRRFAYEAGVSPQVDILPEGDEQRLFNLSMAAVISLEQIREIEGLCLRLSLSRNGEKYNWRKDVLGIVEIIRGNDFNAAAIAESKQRSWSTLAEFLPSVSEMSLEQYRARMQRVLGETYRALDENEADGTKKTASAAQYLRTALATLRERGGLPWMEYAKFGRYEREVGAKSRELVVELVELGQQHASLQAFQSDLRRYTNLLFDCAAASIQEYEAYKKNRGRIDYTDMEVLVLRLLDHPGVQATLTEELDLLMVDEFQDTSPIQLALFLRLSQLAKHCVWVGDPKQSIYGFRGAEPRLMAAVMNANGPLRKENIQTSSWRSREDVVYVCNSLFVHAFPEFSEAEVALDPVRQRGGSEFAAPESERLAETAGLIHWHFTPEGKGRHSQAFMQATLAKAVRDLIEDPPLIQPKGATEERHLRPGDIAILCRSNYGCVAVAEALSAQGIPAAIARDGLLKTAEATLLLACLKYLLNPNDQLSVAELLLFGCRHELPDIIDSRLEHVLAEAENWGQEEEIVATLNDLRAASKEYAPSELLNIILERTDLRRIAAAWGNGPQRLANIDELRRLAIAYEEHSHQQHNAASLGGYLLYLNELLRAGDDRQGASSHGGAVNVLTYHKSKGLEWPAVICFNLDQKLRAEVWGRAVLPQRDGEAVDLSAPLGNRWLRYWVNPYDKLTSGIPWADALNESRWKELAEAEAGAEEARLLYVGFTRARDYLILPTGKPGAPWVDRVYGRGGTQTIVLSPDTTETPFSWDGHDIDKTTRQYIEPTRQPRTEEKVSPLPFLRAPRRGAQAHLPRVVDDAFLLEHFGSGRQLGINQYVDDPRLEPATDLRAFSRAAAVFITGDPRDQGDAYRLELAGRLLSNFHVGGEPDAGWLLCASVGFRSFIDAHWPDCDCGHAVALRGTVKGRRYSDRAAYVITDTTGLVHLIHDSDWPPKQVEQQFALAAAEVRLRAEVLRQSGKAAIGRAFIHLPAAGRLIEIQP